MLYVWIVAIVLFTVIEIFTFQLISVWFAASALISLIAERYGASISLQIVLFASSSIALYFISTFIYQKYILANKVSANMDMIFHKTAIVVDDIQNNKSTGGVVIEGQMWPARSHDGSIIESNSKVTVVKVDGSKLIVKEQI